MSEMNQASQATSTGSQPAASRLIPWRYALTATAGLVAAVLLGLFTVGEAGALVGAAGYLIGAFSLMSRGYWMAGIVGGVVALTGAASLGFHSIETTILGSLLLLGLASWESVHIGSRAFVIGLPAYLMFTVGIGSGGDWSMLIPFTTGVFVGIGVIAVLGLARLIPAIPISPAAGAVLGLFLAIGLSVALVIIRQLDEPRSYLIALIFVGRALAPFEGFRTSTLRYGLGALAGAAIAFLILLFDLPTVVNLALALSAAVVGIRMLLHRLPIAPGLFTVSALLAFESSQQEILFRVMSVAIVVVLALGLSLIIGWLWGALTRRFPRHVPGLRATTALEVRESE